MDGAVLDRAKALLSDGVSVIPVGDDKRPMFSWKEFQTRLATVEEMARWQAMAFAIVTGAISNIVVIDCESVEDARWFWARHSGSPVAVRTPRGVHLYFQHPGVPVANGVRVEGKYDVRGDGGYVVAPPSKIKTGAYKQINDVWLPTRRLPVFRIEWLPREQRVATNGAKRFTDVEAYISRIFATAGQGGHNDTFRAVCRLQEAGLNSEEALAAMIEWNETNAKPPWSVRELLHKVRSAYGATRE